MSHEYKNFEDYRDELLGHLRKFSGITKIDKFTRVGLRYINNIPLEEKEDAYPITSFVRPLIDMSRLNLQDVTDLAIKLTLRTATRKLSVRSGFVPIPAQLTNIPSGVYLLDYDCYTEIAVELAGVSGLLEQFHDRVQRQFLEDLTPEYIEVMRKKE